MSWVSIVFALIWRRSFVMYVADVLEVQAKQTENKIDDELVKLLRSFAEREWPVKTQ